ncbi:PAS domain S-box protein [Sandaracinus amylolyticus]|uniref:histidine kinase n=1 Tax=Sandaracinus amylolyticus TaxID=927083 RepID=A0A0F6WAN3_9BACT|nr:PAS domain S-box protein [Sandaracinus amylolyticus]AKF11673.1 Sensory box histidine kinase/response regulator [Sandaracinus amylolyticus]
MSERWPAPPDGVSEAVLHAAHNAGIGVAVTLTEGAHIRPVWFNERAVEILGRPYEELLRSNIVELLAPEHLGEVHDIKAQRDRGDLRNGAFELSAIRPDGSRIPVAIAMGAAFIGSHRVGVTFFRDIGARRASEDALRASEARFRTLIESAPDGIAITRFDGTMVYANRSAAVALGYAAPSDLVGLDLAQLYEPEDLEVLMDRMRRMLLDGERFPPREYRLLRADGTPTVMEMTGHVIEYDGAPAVLGFGRDVSERKHMQQQLARADRLAALGLLAAGVAHEINNPLTFVSLGVQALERKIELLVADPAVREELVAMLGPMRDGTARVAEIVRDLRAFARSEDTPPPGEIDVVKVIATAERMAAHELRHRARLVRRTTGQPRAHGHAGRLEQVMLNLLVNAMQAFPEDALDPTVIVTCAERDGWVEITVEDNAGGIPEETRARVFDPFFSTKPANVGTGLGLWICHGLVTAMGGTIALESVLGRGTTVRVRMPTASPGSGRARPPSVIPASPDELRPMRVLVVDDEPTLGRLIQLLLSGEHQVHAVTSAEDAIACFDAGEQYDAVLCDVMMPRTSGPELHERVRAVWPDVASRFVFMTGGALTERSRHYLDASPQPLLDKPFSPDVLRHALRRVVPST